VSREAEAIDSRFSAHRSGALGKPSERRDRDQVYFGPQGQLLPSRSGFSTPASRCVGQGVLQFCHEPPDRQFDRQPVIAESVHLADESPNLGLEDGRSVAPNRPHRHMDLAFDLKDVFGLDHCLAPATGVALGSGKSQFRHSAYKSKFLSKGM
jgi:hypothetical protein